PAPASPLPGAEPRTPRPAGGSCARRRRGKTAAGLPAQGGRVAVAAPGLRGPAHRPGACPPATAGGPARSGQPGRYTAVDRPRLLGPRPRPRPPAPRPLRVPEEREIVPMRLEEAGEGVEVQRLQGAIGAPVLQRVPRMRSAQDERGAAGVREVV